jgi:hypothetical protein
MKTAPTQSIALATAVDASRPSRDDVLLDTQCSHYISKNSGISEGLMKPDNSQRLGFPSTSAMVKLLQQGVGAITNAPCNRRLLCKSHLRSLIKGSHSEIFESTIQREQKLSIDIMTVDQNHFLATVVRPLDITLTTFVKSENKRCKDSFERSD